MKITIEGKQGEGKTRMARLIQMAIYQDPKFRKELPKGFYDILVYDGDDKPPRGKDRPKICIVVKQDRP